MQITKFLSVAVLAYVANSAAVPAVYGSSDELQPLPNAGGSTLPSSGSDSDSSSGGSTGGGSTLPSTGDDSDSESSVPSNGGSSNTPATGDSTSPATGGDSTTSPPASGSNTPATGGAGYLPSVSCRNNICYSAVVPSATLRSGAGPIWFQIYAPTTFSWVGFGTGTSMVDSNMFIIYQDGNGNVTLSHRQASGRTMPTVPSDSTVTTTLLPGSGVSNGFMVANFRCDNCTTWKGSERLDFTSTGTPMVGAWREGESLDSTDVEESFGVHTGNIRSFSLDLQAAQKSTAGNPFVGQFAIPAEASGGANNTTDGDDPNSEGAGVGKFSFLSGSVAAAALVTGFSLLL